MNSVVPTYDSSSVDSQGSPSCSSHGNEVFGTAKCMALGRRPLLEDRPPLSVAACFSGATVLITGATGFVGSVVLEQLLRICPTVKRVYVLIRDKRGQTGDERIDWLLHKKPLFHLHWKDGRVPLDVRNKIVVIRGDLHEPDLGLSAADRARIVSEVEYVIHSAASISFFEHIHTLLEQNYEATKKTAELAKGIQNLKGFVHVSTSYVNSNLGRGSHIEEAIHPLFYRNGRRVEHAQLALQLAAMPPAKAERTAQNVLKQVKLPNCYTMTKHMCEELLAGLHCAAFPVAIVRPSIVGAIARAPVPGYFGNAAGVTSATLAFATGMARFTCHDPHNIYDVIPCDLVGSAILVAACALQQPAIKGGDVLVLHAASSTTNPCNYAHLLRNVVHPYWSADPPEHRLSNKAYKSVDHPTAFVPETSLVFKAMRLKHDIRFKMMATGLRLAGQKKVADIIQSSWKVWKLYNTSTMDFHLFFCCNNAAELQSLVVPEEAAQVKMLWEAPEDDWEEYILTHMHTIRAKYFPKKTPEQKAKEGMVAKALPQQRTLDGLSAAAALNAPTVPAAKGREAVVAPTKVHASAVELE